MAALATTDAVLTAFFAADGVCDKLELSVSKKITASEKTQLTRLQAKHTAGTAFTTRDCMRLTATLEHYLKKAT